MENLIKTSNLEHPKSPLRSPVSSHETPRHATESSTCSHMTLSVQPIGINQNKISNLEHRKSPSSSPLCSNETPTQPCTQLSLTSAFLLEASDKGSHGSEIALSPLFTSIKQCTEEPAEVTSELSLVCSLKNDSNVQCNEKPPESSSEYITHKCNPERFSIPSYRSCENYLQSV